MQTNNLCDILLKYPIYKNLLKKCRQHPACNIYHQKVTNLFSMSFRTKSEKIINFIYKQNSVIEETVNFMKDFKANGYFGYFMIIIEIYTAQRVDTQTVLKTIQSNQTIWNDFYAKILPHRDKVGSKLGEMSSPDPTQQVIYITSKFLKEN